MLNNLVKKISYNAHKYTQLNIDSFFQNFYV